MWSATSLHERRNSSVRATKSVSQLTSSSTPDCGRPRGCSCRPSPRSAPGRRASPPRRGPWCAATSTAGSRSPPASSRAFLQSIIPAPVFSRSALTARRGSSCSRGLSLSRGRRAAPGRRRPRGGGAGSAAARPRPGGASAAAASAGAASAGGLDRGSAAGAGAASGAGAARPRRPARARPRGPRRALGGAAPRRRPRPRRRGLGGGRLLGGSAPRRLARRLRMAACPGPRAPRRRARGDQVARRGSRRRCPGSTRSTSSGSQLVSTSADHGMPSRRASRTASASAFEVDHEHGVGQALQVGDAAEVGLQLLELASARDAAPSSAAGRAGRRLLAAQLVQAADAARRSCGSSSAGRPASGG